MSNVWRSRWIQINSTEANPFPALMQLLNSFNTAHYCPSINSISTWNTIKTYKFNKCTDLWFTDWKFSFHRFQLIIVPTGGVMQKKKQKRLRKKIITVPACKLAPVIGHLCSIWGLDCECWAWLVIQTRRWTFKIMAVMHCDFLSFTAHIAYYSCQYSYSSCVVFINQGFQ